MIVTHSFIDKSNTIVEGTPANTGLNPVLALYYGNLRTRCLLHFDHSKLTGLVEDKTYPDITKLRHTLKFWNVSDVNVPRINCPFPDAYRTEDRERATSFELLLLKMPADWDAGRGFDFYPSPIPTERHAYSEYGSNWFYRNTADRWETPGVYTTDEIEEDYNSPEHHIIIASQHFDFGNEQLEMDITDIVNNFISGEETNHGFMLAFAPQYERMLDPISQYAGFFSNRTNTFFEPYVESRYSEVISDDRVQFYLDKPNRLYFYANIGGKNVNLDKLPTCTIDDEEKEVKQATKGVYYIEEEMSSAETEVNVMFYDEWDGIVYNGRQFPATELRFTTQAPEGYYSFGLPYDTAKTPKFRPCISGINTNEDIEQGDVRRLNVECRILYTSNQAYPVDHLRYRVYVKMSDREIDVIEWHECDRMYNTNVFFLNTAEMIPQTYYIDIKAIYNEEEIITKDILHFNIVNNGRQPE